MAMEKDGLKKTSAKESYLGTPKALIVKVCFLGDSGVGKTSIIHRYTKGSFHEDLQPTVESDNMVIEKEYFSQGFKIFLWDLAGSESYNSIVPLYFRGARAFILVYDCTKRETFDSVQDWDFLIRKRIPENVDNFVFILVGNKTDLRNGNETVSAADGKTLADRLGYIFHETSALTGEGVYRLFDKLCSKLLVIQRRIESSQNVTSETSEDKSDTTETVTLTDQPPSTSGIWSRISGWC